MGLEIGEKYIRFGKSCLGDVISMEAQLGWKNMDLLGEGGWPMNIVVRFFSPGHFEQHQIREKSYCLVLLVTPPTRKCTAAMHGWIFCAVCNLRGYVVIVDGVCIFYHDFLADVSKASCSHKISMLQLFNRWK